MSAYDEEDDEQLLTRWQPPSFDPPKPPKKPKAPPIQYPTVEEVEEIRNKARQDAYDMGLSEGFSKGRTDGFEQGREEGHQAGYQQAYQDAQAEILRLHQALTHMLEAITGMPEAIAEPMMDLSYEIAMRVSANERMTRGPFVSAVQEALMRLPKPGSNLFLRIRQEDHLVWKKLIDDPGLPFTCTLLIDSDVQVGDAFVEIEGARINIGHSARVAIVRSALGFDLSKDQVLSSRTSMPELDEDRFQPHDLVQQISHTTDPDSETAPAGSVADIPPIAHSSPTSPPAEEV
jgi:flagellar biosynthesis/type III secretory pathway protein FliH